MGGYNVASDMEIVVVSVDMTPTLLWDLLSTTLQRKIGGREILQVDIAASKAITLSTSNTSVGFPLGADTPYILQSQNIKDKLYITGSEAAVSVSLILSLN